VRNPIDTTSLYEDGALEATLLPCAQAANADVVLFLYREGMHKPDVDKSATQLIVAKNRNGPVDDLPLVFIAEQTAFREPYLAGE